MRCAAGPRNATGRALRKTSTATTRKARMISSVVFTLSTCGARARERYGERHRHPSGSRKAGLGTSLDAVCAMARAASQECTLWKSCENDRPTRCGVCTRPAQPARSRSQRSARSRARCGGIRTSVINAVAAALACRISPMRSVCMPPVSSSYPAAPVCNRSRGARKTNIGRNDEHRFRVAEHRLLAGVRLRACASAVSATLMPHIPSAQMRAGPHARPTIVAPFAYVRAAAPPLGSRRGRSAFALLALR
jgi:hypothetical protein